MPPKLKLIIFMCALMVITIIRLHFFLCNGHCLKNDQTLPLCLGNSVMRVKIQREQKRGLIFSRITVSWAFFCSIQKCQNQIQRPMSRRMSLSNTSLLDIQNYRFWTNTLVVLNAGKFQMCPKVVQELVKK